MELRQLDRKILFELDKNSRSSYAELGRTLRTPPETIRYRINLMVEGGIIEKFYCVVSMGMLGYSLYKIFLKTESAPERTIEELISFALTKPCVVWAVRFDGAFDIGLTLRSEGLKEISETLDAILENFGQYVAKRSFCANIASEYLPRSYLVNKKRTFQQSRGYAIGSMPLRKVDEIDLSLIEQLGTDCRKNAADLAQGIKDDPAVLHPISREGVILRLSRLEKDRLIQGYTVVINHDRIGQLHYKTLLLLNNCTADERRELLEHCRRHSRVQYIIKSIGEWDYELTLEVESVEQLRSILVEITNLRPRMIRDYCSLRITQFRRYNLVSGILERKTARAT